ncbi:hypothetical protein [Nonomuraea rubra]
MVGTSSRHRNVAAASPAANSTIHFVASGAGRWSSGARTARQPA